MTRSIYRPSRMDGDLLETLFVGEERHRLADAIVDRVERALQSQERNHTLVVGRRGAGKTHLVSLVAHRLASGPTAPTPIVAWLPEDPLLIASYRDLLDHIVSWSEPAITVDEDAAADELEAAINAASPAPVVVICENLDQILTGIGPEGQHRFRSFLQNDKSVLLVATSTALTNDLVDDEGPFYAFFTTSHLEPFDADTAATMLTRISEHEDTASIAPYLASERGQARLQAISHLTGGQPRMWAMLGGTLTVAYLEDLVGLLTRRLDSLTPYYQEQLARLAPRQRQVISALARANHPLNAKTLAETIGIDERTVSRTLHDLRNRQWVTQVQGPFADLLSDKRIRFYELSEPMARVMFQLNETRGGKPLQVVAEFATLWFEPHETADSHLHVVDGIADELSLARQLRGLSDTERHITLPTLQRVATALEAAADGNAEALFELPTALRTALEYHCNHAHPEHGLLQLQLDLHERAQRLFDSIPAPEMEWWIDQAEKLTDRTREALPNLATWYADARRFDDAEATVAATERNLGPDHPGSLTARGNLASSYRSAGRFSVAVELERQVLAGRERVHGPDHRDSLRSRGNLASCYFALGDYAQAVELEEQVLTDRERVLGADHPDVLVARNNLAAIYLKRGQPTEAIDLLKQVLADFGRTLGGDHPNTLKARANLGATHLELGHHDEAIKIATGVLAARERVLGNAHPSTQTARNNLAVAYRAAGRADEAIALEA